RAALARAHRAMLDRLSAAPGVKAVSAATCLPLADQGCMAGPIFVEGRALDSGVHPLARFIAVADGYFDTLGTRIVRGRGIDRRDLERNDPVAVVDEALARSAFAGEDPIGRRIRIGSPAVQRTPRWLTIVGVAANTAYRALGEAAPVPKLYM